MMFRNKPVIREAVQYTGSNFEEIVNFCNSARLEKTVSSGIVLIIPTLEGQHIAAYRDWETDRKSTRLNSSHSAKSRMPSSA